MRSHSFLEAVAQNPTELHQPQSSPPCHTLPARHSSVLQELIVQHHLTRYNAGYKFDPVFALGFTSIFDQLMDGFPNEQGREDIFRAYVEALGESPETYRESTKEVEAWASGLDATSLIAFKDREGPVDKLLQVRGWEKWEEGRGGEIRGEGSGGGRWRKNGVVWSESGGEMGPCFGY